MVSKNGLELAERPNRAYLREKVAVPEPVAQSHIIEDERRHSSSFVPAQRPLLFPSPHLVLAPKALGLQPFGLVNLPNVGSPLDSCGIDRQNLRILAGARAAAGWNLARFQSWEVP